MGFGYTRKLQKCTFLRCLQSKFQLFISAMVEIVGRSTFGNVAGSAPVSLAVACTVCGALSKLSMLMCIVIRIGQNLGRNLLIFNVAYPSYAKDHYGKPNVQAHTSRQCCRNVLSCAGKKRRKFFLQLFMLPFCTITFLAQPSAPYFSFLAARTSPRGHGLLYRSCIKLDGHSVFKLTFWKNKRRITI